MAAYVIPSRFSPDAFREPKDVKKLAEAVSNEIKAEYRGLGWKHSFATLGRFDALMLWKPTIQNKLRERSWSSVLTAIRLQRRSQRLPGRNFLRGREFAWTTDAASVFRQDANAKLRTPDFF